MLISNFPETELREVISESFSFGEVFFKFGIPKNKITSYYYKLLQKLIIKYNIDTCHFSKKRKYTEKELRSAISNSTSIRQALIKLKLAPKGGNYRVIHSAIKKYNIDVNHFLGMGWSKNKKFKPKKPLSYYLNDKNPIGSYRLKIRLLKEQIFEPKCSSCKLEFWLELPIPLELEHIDGNHSNNNLENLCLLCPNCHSFTNTYRGKNIGKTSYA